MEPLCSDKFVCRCSGRDSCTLPSRCMLSSLHSAPSSKLPPFCVPVSPVARTAMQAVPCGARSDTRLFPASGSQPRSGQIRSVRTYNSRRYIYFRDKTVLTFFGHIELSRKKRSTGSPRRFRSCLDERGPARRESAEFLLFVPMPTYPRRDPGPKRPRAARPRFPHLSEVIKKSTYNRFV